MTDRLLLGLIGDNIGASRAPLLHRLAGAQNGIEVRYDRLTPCELGLDFDAVFARCRDRGYRGINITYPYKEQVVAKLRIADPLVRAMGAVNTVLFEPEGATGHNTDHSGFIACYRQGRGDRSPGVTLMIGTGGVGRAVAFGLVALGAPVLRLVDRDTAKAERLAEDLRRAAPQAGVELWPDAVSAAGGAEGLVNCTPVGMAGHDGTPLPRNAIDAPAWAFDAVYTPEHTRFLGDAAHAGAEILSGWELFFWQGVHAWGLFSGRSLDRSALRAALRAGEAAA